MSSKEELYEAFITARKAIFEAPIKLSSGEEKSIKNLRAQNRAEGSYGNYIACALNNLHYSSGLLSGTFEALTKLIASPANLEKLEDGDKECMKEYHRRFVEHIVPLMERAPKAL